MLYSEEGARSNKLGVSYLSCYPENYSSVYICPVIFRRVIGRHFSACNAIENHNSTRQSDVALDKFWATQRVYFRLSATA